MNLKLLAPVFPWKLKLPGTDLYRVHFFGGLPL
jgi:hypothetical protein